MHQTCAASFRRLSNACMLVLTQETCSPRCFASSWSVSRAITRTSSDSTQDYCIIGQNKGIDLGNANWCYAMTLIHTSVGWANDTSLPPLRSWRCSWLPHTSLRLQSQIIGQSSDWQSLQKFYGFAVFCDALNQRPSWDIRGLQASSVEVPLIYCQCCQLLTYQTQTGTVKVSAASPNSCEFASTIDGKGPAWHTWRHNNSIVFVAVFMVLVPFFFPDRRDTDFRYFSSSVLQFDHCLHNGFRRCQKSHRSRPPPRPFHCTGFTLPSVCNLGKVIQPLIL